MFGRRKMDPEPRRFTSESRTSHSGPDGALNQQVDAALGELSTALGLDLDFGRAYIFAPSLWQIPQVGEMLRAAGIEANMGGNMLQLLKSPVSVAHINALPVDNPLRSALEQSGFGMVLYNPDAENGYADGLVAMQAQALRSFVGQSTDEARRYAVWDLLRFSTEVMKGRVKL